MNTSWEFDLQDPWWEYSPNGMRFAGKKKPKDDLTEVDNDRYIFAIHENVLNDYLKNKAGGIETNIEIEKINYPEKKEEFRIFMRHREHIEKVAKHLASDVEPKNKTPHYFITSEIYTNLASNI